MNFNHLRLEDQTHLPFNGLRDKFAVIVKTGLFVVACAAELVVLQSNLTNCYELILPFSVLNSIQLHYLFFFAGGTVQFDPKTAEILAHAICLTVSSVLLYLSTLLSLCCL